MTQHQKELLFSILQQPSAPFREQAVRSLIQEILTKGQVPHCVDASGNILVGTPSLAQYKKLLAAKNTDPVRVFVAHMDHPGFHGVRADEKGVAVEWHGGTPTAHLEGATVWVASVDRKTKSVQLLTEKAQLSNAQLHSSGRTLQTSVVQLPEEATKNWRGNPADLFGGFSFRAPVWEDGEIIRTKAADDLVGCYCIVQTALDLYSKKASAKAKAARKNFIGLLTVAEEVGFIGAIAHFNAGFLQKSKRPVVLVSLETSRALPGAEIGKGPILRLGDRVSVFDTSYLFGFQKIADTVLPGGYQKRIMDGGACEASAALAFGIRTIGISVPLGNYHNQSIEGGQDARPANGPGPEFIHQGDIDGLLTLVRGLIESNKELNQPWAQRKKDILKNFAKYRIHLKGRV